MSSVIKLCAKLSHRIDEIHIQSTRVQRRRIFQFWELYFRLLPTADSVFYKKNVCPVAEQDAYCVCHTLIRMIFGASYTIVKLKIILNLLPTNPMLRSKLLAKLCVEQYLARRTSCVVYFSFRRYFRSGEERENNPFQRFDWQHLITIHRKKNIYWFLHMLRSAHIRMYVLESVVYAQR